MIVFYFFAAVAVWIGGLSLRGGFRFYRYITSLQRLEQHAFTPFVSVIAPCRGADEGLDVNIRALIHQRYPAFEVIFVTDRDDDPSVAEIENVMREEPSRQTRLIFAGDTVGCGQKVHNLRLATQAASPDTEVLVFVDTDAQPDPDWLRSLVDPLSDHGLGATTGYRWFIPVAGGFASHLRSVWNGSIASALGAREDRNFCWGGSTAIRRKLFVDLKIEERWRGTISDDFILTTVLQENNLPIRFVPECLVPSFDSCNFFELLAFSNRQLKITRTYAPHLWKPLLLGSFLFSVVFFGGLAIALISGIRGEPDWLLVALLFIIFLLGAIKSYVRLRGVALVLKIHRIELMRTTMAHLLLWPLASLLFLVNCVVAGLSNRIEWRGITYELKSPNEAVIIARKPNSR